MKSKPKTTESKTITILAPEFSVAKIKLVGKTPYVQHRFDQKAQTEIRQKREEGQTALGKKKLDKVNYEDIYRRAMYVSTKGWNGIPATSFRNALIDACRLTNVPMTQAKMCFFIEHDGIDTVDGTPLVKIESGSPHMDVRATRINHGAGTGIAARPMWNDWSVTLRIRYDSTILRPLDIMNLIIRAGMQIGIGEGRPFSKSSAGMGWGCFEAKEL